MVKLERLIGGEPTERVEVADDRMKNLSLEELDQLEGLLSRASGDPKDTVQ